MKEKDLPIDLTKHKVYSKNAKKCVQKLLCRYYGKRTTVFCLVRERNQDDHPAACFVLCPVHANGELDRRGGSYSRNRHPAALKGGVK